MFWKVSVAMLLPLLVAAAISFRPASSRGKTGKYTEHAQIIFNTRCATCHNITPDDQTRRLGPSLHNVGKNAATRRDGVSAAEYIIQSIIDPEAHRVPGTTGRMPQGLLAETNDLRAIVGLLCNEGGQLDDHQLDAIPLPELKINSEKVVVDLDKVHLGESLYSGKGKCSTCHPLSNVPNLTLLGPSLLRIRGLPIEHLRESILEPDKTIAEIYRQVVVQMNDGRILQGRIIDESDEGIMLLDTNSDGKPRSTWIPRSEVVDSAMPYQTLATSSMPSSKDLLTDDEVEAILAFLKTQYGSF